jgi:DNA gyrase/topoisomerase IV subunit A
MITSNINNSHINNIKINTPLPNQKSNTGIKNPINSNINKDVTENKNIELGDIFNIKSGLNNIAEHIRTVNNSINSAQSLVEKIKNDLKIIRKNFPPFPPGSEKRVQLLKNIQAFQKQINELTFPPEILDEWDIVPVVIKDLPRLNLDDNATNEQIVSSAKQFDAIDEKLFQKKTELESFIKDTVNSAFNVFVKHYNDTTHQDISNNQADTISIETKNLLLTESKINLINDHTLLDV